MILRPEQSDQNYNDYSEDESEEEPTPIVDENRKNVEIENFNSFKDRFNVEEELGKGRYGLVRKITDKISGTILAAKFIKTIKQADRKLVQEEIKIMNMLNHSKLLKLIAAYERPRETIMVTEYISGGELFERVVADDFTLTERDSILFMRQICMAVRYIHKMSIVHLDLKPENIMCHTRTSHRIKVIDFGLAQILKPGVPLRVLFGTPEFMPPEIISYEPIGTESDMWSVGVICYTLLTGLSPFMGDDDAETLANVTRAEFDFDDEAFDAISQNAKDFISSLLIKKKELRMSAETCLNHPWIAQHTENMRRVALPTEKLKKFIVRRKWQKTGNAIRALGRMAMLSNNKRSTSSEIRENSVDLEDASTELNKSDLCDDSLTISESKKVNAETNDDTNQNISNGHETKIRFKTSVEINDINYNDNDEASFDRVDDTNKSSLLEDQENKVNDSDDADNEQLVEQILANDKIDVPIDVSNFEGKLHEDSNSAKINQVANSGNSALKEDEPSTSNNHENSTREPSIESKSRNRHNKFDKLSFVNREENSTVPNKNHHLINCFTGNVNRTAKMFEKKDAPTGSAKEKSCDYISMPVHSTKDHNEKFKKTFAFWNK